MEALRLFVKCVADVLAGRLAEKVKPGNKRQSGSVVKDEEEGMMGTAVEVHTKICVPHVE
jgi:hypothetical protein